MQCVTKRTTWMEKYGKQHPPHTVAANTISVDIISPKLEMTVSRAEDMLCNG